MLEKILKALLPDDRKALMDAFDNVIPHFVEVDQDHYVGVHVDNIDYLESEEDKGFFSYGKINKDKKGT